MQGQQTLTAENQADEQHHIFKLVGTGSMYKMQVPGLDEEAMCFDVDLYNAGNKLLGQQQTAYQMFNLRRMASLYLAPPFSTCHKGPLSLAAKYQYNQY